MWVALGVYCGLCYAGLGVFAILEHIEDKMRQERERRAEQRLNCRRLAQYGSSYSRAAPALRCPPGPLFSESSYQSSGFSFIPRTSSSSYDSLRLRVLREQEARDDLTRRVGGFRFQQAWTAQIRSR